MRAILILVIASMLIFTLGCDFDKEKINLKSFKSKLDSEKNTDQEPTVKNSPLDKEEEKRRKLFEDMKRK